MKKPTKKPRRDSSVQFNLSVMFERGEVGGTENKGESMRVQNNMLWYNGSMLKILRIIIISAALLASTVTSFAVERCIKTMAECVEDFREEAEQGDVEMQNGLGAMYYNGLRGIAVDKREALRWFRLAAEQGFMNAQFNLGVMYDDGDGVAEDKIEALRLYRLAAEQGFVIAQYRLGNRYRIGEGVNEDKREAVRWFRLAAEQGDAGAQNNLGWMYYNGEGVVQDERESYIWLLIAKAGGDELASEGLQSPLWRNDLTSADIRSAKSEAARRFERIENRKNSDAQPSENNSAQKSGGEFAVAKPPKQTNIAATVFENTWRSVVMIEDSAGNGSGVIIRPNLVATNCHVVDGGSIVVYKPENKRINEKVSFSAKVVHRNQAHDFCILEVKGLWGIAATIRKYDTLKIGENVYALGAPLGLDMSLSEGLISQLREIDNVRYIQTDAAISPGSSGGGLFDVDGNFVGMPTQKYTDEEAEGLGFAIPADLALEF